MKLVKIKVRTCFMERRSQAEPQFESKNKNEHEFLIQEKSPSKTEYRSVFQAVGSEWGWTGHMRLTDDELGQLLNDPCTRYLELSHQDHIIGFAFLDGRVKAETEILYIGLIPGYEGRGLGKLLLLEVFRLVGKWNPGIIKLHTCALDHPGAKGFYEKMGFITVKEKYLDEYYPLEFLRSQGIDPENAVS